MNSKFSMTKSIVVAAALVAGFSGVARAEQQHQVTTRYGQSERHFIAAEASEGSGHNSPHPAQTRTFASTSDAQPAKTASN